VPTKSWRRLLAGAVTSLAVSASGLALTATAAQAETIAATTTCTNPYTSAQAGPSSFTFTVPTVIHTGDSVPIQLSFDFANTSGYDLSDVNSFSMASATPVALAAGSQGAIANGATKTITLTGTWSASAAGTQAITAAGWTFNIVVGTFTIPVSCTFDSTVPSITRTVSAPPPPPTLATSATAVRPKGTVGVSGANWAPSSSGTVSLCASAAGTGTCTAIGTASTNAAGKLTGKGTVPATATAGAHGIKVTIGSASKAKGLYILGSRLISLSSKKVKAGQSVTVKGKGWDPAAKLWIAGLTKSKKAACTPLVTTADSHGNFTATLKLAKTTITLVGAAESSSSKLAAPSVAVTVTGTSVKC
jgi:hypothetical protein